MEKRPVLNEASNRIAIAKHYIEANYMNDIQLEDIAAAGYLSVTHLNRKFKEVYGLSPHQYLIRIRLNKAKSLLAESDELLKDIVYNVGLNCCSSFVRTFRKEYGITPCSYRQQQRITASAFA